MLRPLALPLSLLALLPALLVGPWAPQAPATAPATAPAVEPVTVLLLRHAEKAADDPRDPSLSEAGTARAEALAALLAEAGVTHLFATEFVRTRATLAPLAARVGLEVTVVPAGDGAAQLARLRALPAGAVAVVAGHSNTVPGMARDLGVTPRDLEDHPRYGPMLPDDAYDRLYMVTLSTAQGVAPKLVELRYGP